jgi:hypothetical protein
MANEDERRDRRRALQDRLAALHRSERDFLERMAARAGRSEQGSGDDGSALLTDPLSKRLKFLLADVRKSREAVERQLAHA